MHSCLRCCRWRRSPYLTWSRPAPQDVEVQIGEYDADVGAKEEELGKARAEYEEVLRQLQVRGRVCTRAGRPRTGHTDQTERVCVTRSLQHGLCNSPRSAACNPRKAHGGHVCPTAAPSATLRHSLTPSSPN